jgi:hypothetical protein
MTKKKFSPNFFFLAVLGFELRVLCLLGRHSASSPSCSGYFGDRVLFFCAGWPGPQFFYFIIHFVAGITGARHCAQLSPLSRLLLRRGS